MKEVISILMPVKNTAKYLRECLDSILEQSYLDWELLAVDDDSRDDSYDILKKYSEKDQRIKAFNNDGQGIITALRKAYQKASGQLITRMDSDDRMAVDKLALMSETLTEKGKGYLVVGLVEYFSEHPMGAGYLKYAEWLNILTLKTGNFKEIYKECVIPSPCWMLWKSDLERCGAFRPNDYPEDYDLCFRMYQEGMEIISIPEILHYWRDYSERTSRNDPNYQDNRFAELKVKYFLDIDYDHSKTLFLWGAGNKGKDIAKKLVHKNIPLQWVCDNEKKIGKHIYGIEMEHFEALTSNRGVQVIVAVSSPEGQIEIRKWLKERSIEEVFYFC